MDRQTILITGGHGFIGSYVARSLYRAGRYQVRIIDIAPKPSHFTEEICHEAIIGNISDINICRPAVDGAHIVLHFAANMGGMGTIHDGNDFTLYSENHFMTLTLLRACVDAGVQRFFYASSACIYPEHLQRAPESHHHSISLREDDAYAQATAESPPHPQGLYGLEKLNTELLLHQMASRIDIRIARFHNVYGPGGAWNNGREKAPAALLRKAVALKHLAYHEPKSFELWGDGSQLRSFLFVDDAVAAILQILASDYIFPVNVGSDTVISVRGLAETALRCAELDPASVRLHYLEDKPTGVPSRNSNNDRIESLFGWKPTISLEEGMKRTMLWIEGQVDRLISQAKDDETRRKIITELQRSEVVDLRSESITFAILLPITSRGGPSPISCLQNLETFARSLVETSWRDTHSYGGNPYRLRIYVAIDDDDEFLLSTPMNKAEAVLRKAGLDNITSILCRFPRGHVCSLWRECARKAWVDNCDYMVLLGDDVKLLDEGWMRNVHAEFQRLADSNRTPFGIGCVAFSDISFPGMPTFPVIHRRHMDIFAGVVVPDVFINQDGDPFLYQLYRHWDCSKMIEARVANSIGGSDDARYDKLHAKDWTFDTLENAVNRVEDHLQNLDGVPVNRVLTLDVIIPCYRVDLDILSSILGLKHSPTVTVMFIIIIDNPNSPYIHHLQSMFSHRPDVRIRVNRTNLGASASRNRGLAESAAEWAHFLDDDIVPEPNLLFEAEKIIRAHPNASGFVGNTTFPVATTIFQSAVHLAGVTYFWDIATKIHEDLPWGVTANLIARRNIKDGVEFELVYPKTGGGEDIEFCRLKREKSLKRGGEGFVPAPKVLVTHPWWKGGARSYWRFYMWSYGDGALVARFPDLCYRDHAPNSAELIVLCIFIPLVALPFFPTADVLTWSAKALLCVVLVNIVHDLWRHLFRHPERHLALKSDIKSGPWFWIVLVESTLIRISSEMGRLRGMVDRGEWRQIGRRFDWFAGRFGRGPMEEERKNNLERLVLLSSLLVLSFQIPNLN